MSSDSIPDLTSARNFVANFGDSFRYDHTRRRWFAWDGTRWKLDASESVVQAGVTVVDTRADLEGMLRIARALTPIATTHDAWDTNAHSLTCANGTVDLRTGQLAPHAPADMITKIAPVRYDPLASAPRWYAFLDEIFAGNADLIAFCQRAIGMSLIGETRERALFICHGGGANGKSTLLKTIHNMLGDYAGVADPELLLAHKDGQHPANIAALVGKRFASQSEIKAARTFDEGQLKRLTGGDPLTARFMRQDFFEVSTVSFTLWLAVNDLPSVSDFTPGFWDRVNLLPFTVRIPRERWIDDLAEQLVADEGPGILAWAVAGTAAYLAQRLSAPAAVLAATAAYRMQEDWFAQFSREECVIDADADPTTSAVLFAAYKDWADRMGLEPVSGKRFGAEMRKHDLTPCIFGPSRLAAWRGIRLRRDSDDAEPVAPETPKLVSTARLTVLPGLSDHFPPGDTRLVGSVAKPDPSCRCGEMTANGQLIDCLEHCPF